MWVFRIEVGGRDTCLPFGWMVRKGKEIWSVRNDLRFSSQGETSWFVTEQWPWPIFFFFFEACFVRHLSPTRLVIDNRMEHQRIIDLSSDLLEQSVFDRNKFENYLYKYMIKIQSFFDQPIVTLYALIVKNMNLLFLFCC